MTSQQAPISPPFVVGDDEAIVLALALESAEVAALVCEQTRATDFTYEPHPHIRTAMGAVLKRGEPVVLPTVAFEMRRRNWPIEEKYLTGLPDRLIRTYDRAEVDALIGALVQRRDAWAEQEARKQAMEAIAAGDVATAKERLERLEKPATSYVNAPPAPISAADLGRKVIEPPRYFIPGIFRAGLALYIGNPGIGKTPALAQLALAFANGGKWLGALQCPKVKVLYIGVEYDEAYIKEVLVASTGGTDLPDNLMIHSLETFTSPQTAEESIATLRYYLEVDRVEVVIIDVFSGFLPRENFKQNAYRGDYAEFLAYHRLCMEHRALIVGAWHGGKRDKDPETSYNGGQGMWGSAGGGRITMFYDEGQQVRLRSQLRGHERLEWVLEQARAGGAHFWAVVDADPDPILGSDAQARVYRAVKDHGSISEPISPAGVRAVLKADAPENCPADAYIRQTLSRLAERGIIVKGGGGGYYVQKRGSRGSAVTYGSVGSGGSGEAIHGGSENSGGWIAPRGQQEAVNGTPIQPIHRSTSSYSYEGLRDGEGKERWPVYDDADQVVHTADSEAEAVAWIAQQQGATWVTTEGY